MIIFQPNLSNTEASPNPPTLNPHQHTHLGPAALPPTGKDDGPSKFQVEHCFALPAPAHTSSSSSSPAPTARYRLKVVQQFRRDWSSGAWVLDCVDLHRER